MQQLGLRLELLLVKVAILELVEQLTKDLCQLEGQQRFGLMEPVATGWQVGPYLEVLKLIIIFDQVASLKMP